MSNPFAIKEVAEVAKTSEGLEKQTKAFENAKKEVTPPRHITTINEGLKGQKYPETDVVYKSRTFKLNGEKVEGVFPVFPSKFDTLLPKDLRTKSDPQQFQYCTKQLAKRIEANPSLAERFTPRQLEQIKNGAPRIAGLTWHHSEIPGKMQLVDANLHTICRHTGGRYLWGGGSGNR